VFWAIGPLHDPVTWYGINYTGTQVTQWDLQNKGTRTSPARLSFVFKVPQRNLRPSVSYSVLCDWIVQRAYCVRRVWANFKNLTTRSYGFAKKTSAGPASHVEFVSKISDILRRVPRCHYMNVVLRSTKSTSNGRSNPEVVGSIPTEVKRFFLYLLWFRDSLCYGANAQWVIHGFK